MRIQQRIHASHNMRACAINEQQRRFVGTMLRAAPLLNFWNEAVLQNRQEGVPVDPPVRPMEDVDVASKPQRIKSLWHTLCADDSLKPRQPRAISCNEQHQGDVLAVAFVHCLVHDAGAAWSHKMGPAMAVDGATRLVAVPDERRLVVLCGVSGLELDEEAVQRIRSDAAIDVERASLHCFQVVAVHEASHTRLAEWLDCGRIGRLILEELQELFANLHNSRWCVLCITRQHPLMGGLLDGGTASAWAS